MKNFKKILALLLALAMVFALCACDGGKGRDRDDDKEPKPEKLSDAELIVGDWEVKVSVVELGIEDFLGEANKYFDFSDVYYTLSLSFTEDGEYELVMSLDAEVMRNVFRNGMKAMLEEELAGTGFSLADYAASENMTEEQFIDAMLDASVDMDSMFADETETGTYKIEDGKLYLLDENDEDTDEYMTYEFDGEDELTILASYEDGAEDDSGLFPLTFGRI